MTRNGLCIGDEAPDFTLRDQFGQDVRLGDFRGRKAVAILFSVYALRSFAETEGLNFPLLSDWWPHGAVSRAYEVFDEGRGAPRRSSYVVDRDGRLRWSVHNANPDGRDLDEHLRELHAAVDQHLV